METRKGVEIHDQKMLEIFDKKYGEALGYGMTAIVYKNNGYVLKVFYPKYGKAAAFKEAYMLSVAEVSGLQSPRVISVKAEDGYWILEMTEVKGESLLMKIIGELSKGNKDTVITLTKQLADIHAEITSKSGGSLPDSKNVIRSKILTHDVLTEEEKESAIRYLDSLTGGNSMCHGDFHPNQVLIQEDGSYKIIDFADIGCGNPAGDVALTWLNLSTPPQPLRDLFNTVDIPGIYLNEYIDRTGISKEEIEKWIPVQAAAFLNVAPPYRDILGKYLPK